LSIVQQHYGWKSKDTKNLELLLRCALAYLDFEVFSKIANIVVLRRHQHSLFYVRTRSIGYRAHGLRDPSPFTLQDLQILSQFATKKDGTDDQHGRLLTAQSLDDEKELSRVREWSSCSDGALMIGDQALRTLRPQHYHRYLLEEDRFGVLCPAENRAETDNQKTSKRNGDSISPHRAKVQRTNADRPSFPNLPQGKHSQRLVVGTTCDMERSIVKAIPLGIRTGSEDALRPTTSSDCSHDANDGRQLDSLARAASSPVLASKPSDTRRPMTKHTDAMSLKRGHYETSNDEVGSKLTTADSRARRDSTLEDDRRSADQSTCQDPQQTRDHSLSPASTDTLTDQSNRREVVLPSSNHTSTERCKDQNCPDELQTSITFTGSDASICNIIDYIVFPPGISDTEKAKLQRWAGIVRATEDQAPHRILKH
jgi:hypothetical protein